MRELERDHPDNPTLRCAVVGAGRMGHALAIALREAGLGVEGPLGRSGRPAAAEVVLLCVPDAAIAGAAAELEPGPLVGHCSGATGLDVLAPHEAFALHPLMTVPAQGRPAFAGAGCAVAGSTPRALATALALAQALGLRCIEVADADRPAYHAAAALASNFLVTVEAAAERLAATAAVPRELLLPLARAALENWGALGAREALTGPITRGDEATVARQREAVAARAPELLELWDALAACTRVLADQPEAVPA